MLHVHLEEVHSTEVILNETTLRRLHNVSNHLVTDLAKNPSMAISNCPSTEFCSSNVDKATMEVSPLETERKQASFVVQELTYILDGDPQFTKFKELMANFIENDEILRDEDRYDLTRPQARERTMAKLKRVIEIRHQGENQDAIPRSGKKTSNSSNETGKAANQGKTVSDAFWYVMGLYDPNWATRIGVHYGLFLSAITGQGTEEQVKKYENDIHQGKVLGCFAMTELGHGSYIQGFETTAIYDKHRQEFIINSPTDTSTKWWIGGAGQTATHAVVFARLLIDQKDYGVHCFIVPIRSVKDGYPLPNISIGDCGSKMGRNGLDNGWIQFSNVRIPRENMLMKWSKVSPEGVYEKPPKAQLSYGSLILGRVSIIQDASDYAKKALTIAIRYSAVRRQFLDSSGKQEEQLLNYQTHQHRLLPLLATCFALHFTSNQMNNTYNLMMEELSNGDISNLDGVHATSAGLKAFSTWWCNAALEQCRQCLGGHGYSSYAGISSLLADFAVMCTWEGDNTVLAQQTSRFLLKALKNAEKQKGKKMAGFESYLQRANLFVREQRFPGNETNDLLDSHLQLKVLRRLSSRLVMKANRRMQSETSKGRNKSEAWNNCMVDLVHCAKVHCDYYILQCFVDAIRQIKEDANGCHAILKKLCDLHAMTTFDYYGNFLLEDRYFGARHIAFVRENIRSLCREIRKDAVPLVDSFNFPDFALCSPLGRYDGQVYKHYMEIVKKAPAAIGRPSYWENIIKPLTNPD